jgi:hypothetical protein
VLSRLLPAPGSGGYGAGSICLLPDWASVVPIRAALSEVSSNQSYNPLSLGFFYKRNTWTLRRDAG